MSAKKGLFTCSGEANAVGRGGGGLVGEGEGAVIDGKVANFASECAALVRLVRRLSNPVFISF